jgi:hypothetical protein
MNQKKKIKIPLTTKLKGIAKAFWANYQLLNSSKKIIKKEWLNFAKGYKEKVFKTIYFEGQPTNISPINDPKTN